MTILHADTRDDSSNHDWETAIAAKDSHPILALIAIVIVLAVTAALVASRAPGPHDLAPLFGGAVVGALLAWGVAYAVTLRHASIAWRIGTLAIVLLLALLWAVGMVGADTMATKRDVAMLAEMRLADDGTVILPPDADRGPVSRIFVTYANDTNRLKRAQAEALRSLGVQHVADPQALTRTPALLRDCNRFVRAKPGSDARLGAMRERLGQFSRDMDKAAIPPVMRGSFIAGMKHSLARDQGKLAVLAGITGAQLEEAQALCTVLARRRWQAHGTMFLFTSESDRALYDRHILRWNTLLQQEQGIYAASRQQVVTGQQLIRDAVR